MNPARFQRVKELYLAACERESGARGSFLDQACAGDAELRAELESLLAHDRVETGFLEQPGARAAIESSWSDVAGTALPERLGRYAIQGVLGAGGMGIVYLAEQEQPRRSVALKVLPPGAATPRTLRLFEREAALLGRLQHPGIAQIFEAGTFESGLGPRPFFAMEYVRGVSLVRFAKEQALAKRARLELFLEVCEAVEHAHRRGVIHRDLKPDNILVDERGEPKVLDFGVARATDSDLAATTRLTDAGQVIGTLPYMSPEQVSGDPRALDARSDVYALGVLLYELLTGRLPYDVSRGSIAEAARVIQEQDPAPISSHDRTLRGDVTTIVAKALEKEKARRYAGVAELAGDIRRHLADQPIAARPVSTLYQVRKFTRRNKVLVGGIAAVVVALIAGIAATSRQARAAEREASKLRLVQRFIDDMFASLDPDVARGRDVSVLRELLDDTAARVESELRSEPESEAILRATIGRAYHSLAAFDAAELHLRAALELERRLHGDDEPRLAESLASLAGVLNDRSDFRTCEELRREEVALRRHSPHEPLALAGALSNLASAVRAVGRHDEAALLYEEAHALWERQGVSDGAFARSLNNYANFLQAAGRPAQAAEAWERALELVRAQEPEGSSLEAGILDNWAPQLLRAGDLDGAERMWARVLEIRQKLFRGDRPELADSLINLAGLALERERFAEAEQRLRAALDMRRRLFGERSVEVAQCLQNLGSTVRQLGRHAEAEPLIEEALALFEEHKGPEHVDLALVLVNLANLRMEQGERAAAAELLERTLEIYRKNFGPDHPQVGWVVHMLGTLAYEGGDLDSAESLWAESLAIRRRALPAGDVATASSLWWLGWVLFERGDAAQAEPLLRESLTIRRAALPRSDPRVAESFVALGRALAALGRREEARAQLSEGLAASETALGAEHEETRRVARLLAELDGRDATPSE